MVIVFLVWLLFFQFVVLGFLGGRQVDSCHAQFFVSREFTFEKVDYDNGRNCTSNHINNNSN
jgi:hypothetical protein